MNRIIILVIFLSFTTSLQAQSVESDELFSKGVELYNLKRYNEAISYFNKSNNIDKALLDTTNSRRYYSEMWLSSCYMQLGKIKEAQAISPDYYMVPPIDRRLTVESDRFSELSNMFAQAGNLEVCFTLCRHRKTSSRKRTYLVWKQYHYHRESILCIRGLYQCRRKLPDK